VFSFSDERHLERYIQNHQQAIIRLMDQLLSSGRDHAGYKVYYNTLEDLLSFVERHFTKYFDQDLKAPESYILIAQNEFRRSIAMVQEELAKKGVDKLLTEVSLFALQKIIRYGSHSDTTYRKVMYAKQVQKELEQFITKDLDGKDANEELRQVLFYLNFNSIVFFNYYTAYIISLLERVETTAERIEALSLILKKINQVQVKPGIGYKHFSSSLRTQLNDYLAEEIDHQNRLRQLVVSHYATGEESVFRLFKIKLELSVSQFAYLIKILTEIKIIHNKNLAELIRFLTRFFITKRSESISYESFRVRYYNVEHSTKESVKNVLLAIVNYIDKN
jgi:hypothetical protein